jgi:release factor glutamine methyltransferase
VKPSPKPAPRTIAEAIDACRDRLVGHSPTPWLDARLLAQFITGLDASAVIAYGDAVLDRGRKARLFELTERRAAGEPVAYLVGRKSFCGLDIAVDRRALVPRPETEALVEACVEGLRDRGQVQVRIADVGTGSGAIACALAHFLPEAAIVASDVSTDALELAAHNIERLGFAEQITLVRSDVLDGYASDARFDALVANLPYVADDAADDLEPGVRDHEPTVALMSGADGLDAYRKLMAQAPRHLDAEGSLYVECASTHAAALAKLARSAFPNTRVEVRRDLAGLDRYVIARPAQQ